MVDFIGFPKIPRFNKIFGKCIVSEKIDGTNSHILIEDGKIVRVGSRNRWITPKDDNYGFAGWVERHNDELLKLGDGHHFGEWYGNGIQHGYGLKEKRWALFNTFRWNPQNPNLPSCCHVVPELYRGVFTLSLIDEMATKLSEGSVAVPGQKAEGFVIFLAELNQMIKWTYNYQEGKWKEN